MSKDRPLGPDRGADPTAWVDRHGDALYGYALARLRVPAEAEDLVQETFLAALRGRDRFAGRSSERTWLVGILKRKLVDRLRRKSRERPLPGPEEADAWAQRRFDRRGKWTAAPGDWGGDPAEVMERREFWEAFARCLAKLPTRLHDAFALRELDALAGHRVCQALGVSANHLWTLLYRARLRLIRCLEDTWFGSARG